MSHFLGPHARSSLLGAAVWALSTSGTADEPAAPRPELELVVQHSGPTVPWRATLRNAGSRPLRLEADSRLLWLEVKVPGRKTSAECRLPSGIFPERPDPAASVVLAPGESVGHDFDPRLYCFADAGQWQLVPGSQVTPHFGWAPEKKVTWKQGKRVETVLDRPPYVARVAGEPQGKPEPGPKPKPRGGLKQVDGARFALGSEYAVWSKTRVPSDPTEASEDAPPEPFTLTLTQGSDAEAERNAVLTTALTNRSQRAHYIYFRRELVSYEVAGPAGVRRCDPEPDLRAPERHAFTRLQPGGSVREASRLIELCPLGTFAEPGLYLVHARYESNHDGADFDLDAFVGRVVSRDPIPIRIRTGERRSHAMRRLDPPGGKAPPAGQPPPADGHPPPPAGEQQPPPPSGGQPRPGR